MKIYTVTAYRWGNRENHSYIVSVRSTVQDALKDAEIEEEHLGGKYRCEVLEWELDECATAGTYEANTIKPLTNRTVQQMMADLDLFVMQTSDELR